MAIREAVLTVRTMRTAKGSKWSAWQQPVMRPKRYTMFCCDCSLCHQFEFRVGQDRDKKPRVQFRAKRADLYTQMRRKSKVEKKHISSLKKGECVRALVNGAMVVSLVNGLRRGGTKREKRNKR